MRHVGSTLKRCFLVGCPRSGTTLLQTMLGRHSSILTVPETHFLQKIRGRFASRPPLPIVSPRAARRALEAVLTACGHPTPVGQVPGWWLGRGRYVTSFRQAMDAAAESSGATVWVEKSPVHLHYVDEIRRWIPDALFIHILRDGRDVVASLVEACERHPELWVPQLLGRGAKASGREQLMEAAAARWNADLERSLSRRDESGHILICYEDLVVAPRRVLDGICVFLGVAYEESMERHWETADLVVGERAGLPHMEKVLQPLEDRRLRRFHQIFDPNEQAYVTGILLRGGYPGYHAARLPDGD